MFACWRYGKTFHVSVKRSCLCMNRHLFIQVKHFPLTYAETKSVHLFSCLLRYRGTHIHIKELRANGKRRKKISLPEIMYIY